MNILYHIFGNLSNYWHRMVRTVVVISDNPKIDQLIDQQVDQKLKTGYLSFLEVGKKIYSASKSSGDSDNILVENTMIEIPPYEGGEIFTAEQQKGNFLITSSSWGGPPDQCVCPKCGGSGYVVVRMINYITRWVGFGYFRVPIVVPVLQSWMERCSLCSGTGIVPCDSLFMRWM